MGLCSKATVRAFPEAGSLVVSKAKREERANPVLVVVAGEQLSKPQVESGNVRADSVGEVADAFRQSRITDSKSKETSSTENSKDVCRMSPLMMLADSMAGSWASTWASHVDPETREPQQA
jgi:hypothetical protein